MLQKDKNRDIYGHGKLLISGEYFILDGAEGLAIPTRFGQKFNYTTKNDQGDFLVWRSFDHENFLWFTAIFKRSDFSVASTSDDSISHRLKQILIQTRKLNPEFLLDEKHLIEVTSYLEFASDWGLGSSSTLIYAIAKWASVDPFTLLDMTFGGSGYDIACAMTDQPILYRLENGNPEWEITSFKPVFSDQIYFIHLGRKMNSRKAIASYRKRNKPSRDQLADVNELTRRILKAENVEVFINAVNLHEELVSNYLGIARVMEYFPDFEGACKSLGGWGGDFIMAIEREKKNNYCRDYFMSKGKSTVLSWAEMVFESNQS